MAKVTVYSTPVCPYCITLKNFLKKHGIDFVELDVSQDEEALRAMREKSQQSGVPVVEINGEIVVGFDKPAIMDLLNLEEE